MRRDLYSYGRSSRREIQAASQTRSSSATFVCAGCGCSASAAEQDLLLAIGWKALPAGPDDADVPALCPPCNRRGVRGVF